MTTVEQPELLPATPPTFKALYVSPADLPPNDLLDGPEPSRELVQSIRQYGVVDPIVIRRVDGMDFEWVVLSGSRRVKAVRLLHAECAGTDDENNPGIPVPTHLRRIPARVIDNVGDSPADVLTIQANTLRSRNKAAEFKAVKRLMEAGADDKAISRATGLTHAQIKELLRLDRLNETLLDAMAEGRITGTQAHDIARLPQPSQDRLVEVFQANGKLTATDVHTERQARQETATQTMDWGAINAVPASVEADPTTPEAMLTDLAFRLVEGMRTADTSSFSVDVEVDGRRFTVSVNPA